MNDKTISRIVTTLIVLALLIGLLLVALGSARTYTGMNSGIAWDWGGVELAPVPGVFLCAGQYNPSTGTYTPNPLASLYPEIVADC